jgi:hypothetical protein
LIENLAHRDMGCDRMDVEGRSCAWLRASEQWEDHTVCKFPMHTAACVSFASTMSMVVAVVP